MRNPFEDPQPGDVVAKTMLKGRRTRTVTKRQGGDIWYTTENGKTNSCWITTWASWCVGASVVTVARESLP